MRTNAAVSIPVPRVLTNAFLPYVGFVVVIALLLGGGARQGLPSDALVELAALPLFAWAAFRVAPRRLEPLGRWALVLLIAIIALPLLQLIPMPPAFWTLLPGRDRVAETYDFANIAKPWLPLSLDPAATWLGLLALIPGAAVFLATLSLDMREQRILVGVVLVIAFIAVWIGLFQIMGATDLYFYAVTNEGMAVGFFANGNHNAAFLAASIPFSAAWAITVFSGRQERPITMLAVGILLPSLILGVAIVGSRAGLGLGFVAGVLCIAMLWRAGVRFGGRFLPISLGGFLTIALIVTLFGFAGWDRRGVQERDILSDIRWPVAGVTLRASQNYLPFGTGFGTFQPIYEMSAPRTQVLERYVNHAHDDWLELALEGGVPALVVLTGFLGWFGSAGFRAWRTSGDSPPNGSFARAGSIAILILLLHSVVDYPMRSIAMMIIIALSCGSLIPRPRDGRGTGDGKAARTR